MGEGEEQLIYHTEISKIMYFPRLFAHDVDHRDNPEHLDHPAQLDTSRCRRIKNTLKHQSVNELSRSYLGKVVRSFLRAKITSEAKKLAKIIETYSYFNHFAT